MFKAIKRYFQRRFDRFYLSNRLHLVLDASLVLVILVLVGLLVKLNFYQPTFNSATWTVPEKIRVDLNNPSLEVNFNPQTEAIRIQDAMLIELYLKNNGQIAVDDLKLNLVLANNDFLISKVEIVPAEGGNNLTVKGNELFISEIKSGSELSANLKVYFKTRSKGATIINWQIDSEYSFDHQVFKNVIKLNDVKVASTLNASAAGYYNSPQGDQLGSGPLPPVVGLPTNLWIFFKVEPTGNFGEFVMSAKLPKNVSFTDNTSMLAGNLTYSSSSRQVIWQVDGLSKDENDYRAGFEVQIIPTKEQIGKSATLLDGIRFKALDIFTNLQISGAAPLIDTELGHDALNQGEGKIVAE